MEYLIAGKNFKLIEFGDLTPKKELVINSYLEFNNVKDGIEMNLNAENIFPLLLIPIDGAVLDVSEISYNQMIEIIIDYKEAKQSYQDNAIQKSGAS
jgi:hypothetical protein